MFLAGQERFDAGRRDQSGLDGAGRARPGGALLGTEAAQTLGENLQQGRPLWP